MENAFNSQKLETRSQCLVKCNYFTRFGKLNLKREKNLVAIFITHISSIPFNELSLLTSRQYKLGTIRKM